MCFDLGQLTGIGSGGPYNRTGAERLMALRPYGSVGAVQGLPPRPDLDMGNGAPSVGRVAGGPGLRLPPDPYVASPLVDVRRPADPAMVSAPDSPGIINRLRQMAAEAASAPAPAMAAGVTMPDMLPMPGGGGGFNLPSISLPSNPQRPAPPNRRPVIAERRTPWAGVDGEVQGPPMAPEVMGPPMAPEVMGPPEMQGPPLSKPLNIPMPAGAMDIAGSVPPELRPRGGEQRFRPAPGRAAPGPARPTAPGPGLPVPRAKPAVAPQGGYTVGQRIVLPDGRIANYSHGGLAIAQDDPSGRYVAVGGGGGGGSLLSALFGG